MRTPNSVEAHAGVTGTRRRLGRNEVLSEYPVVMLADAEHERRRSAVEQMARVESLREERRRVRSEGR
jgi:hypothetical protein